MQSTNTWTNVTDAKTNAYNASRVTRMKEIHDAIRAVNPSAYFINENLAGEKEENEMAQDGEINWANINEASCQFAMGFNSNASLNRFYAPLTNALGALQLAMPRATTKNAWPTSRPAMATPV